MLNCISCLYILTINSLLVMSFASILFHSVGCLFFFFFFCCVKAFNFKKVLSLFKYQLLESYNCCLISYFCFNYTTVADRSTMYILSHFTSNNITPLPESCKNLPEFASIFSCHLFCCYCHIFQFYSCYKTCDTLLFLFVLNFKLYFIDM